MRLLLLAVAAMAMVAPMPTRARQVKFAVVAFGTDVKVDVGGTVSALAAPFPDNPYFNGTIEVPDGAQSYKYVVDAASEPFDRSIDRTTASTFNDFFGRKDTISQPPQFGFAFPGDKREQWTRGSKAEIFDDSYIPTVHFSGPNADSWVKNTGDAQVNVMFVSQRDVLTFQNVEASTKNEETVKAALKLKFPGEDFYGRSSIKLRNSEEDVTMLREKIYADMLAAAGCPTMGTAIARVYYNKQPLGLYVLQDSAPDEGFIASLFYGNPNDSINRPRPMGTPLDGASGSDFEYKEGVTLPYNSFLPPPGVVPNPEKIAAVSKALNDLDVTNAAAVADFESGWFDIETFFRAAAFEYLAGHWDSYWFFTTNFVVYDDPTESNNGRSKFYFIDQDFDQTFGVNIGPQYNSVGADFTKQSYTTLLKDKWKITELDAETRTIINKLIRTPGSILKSRFENILISIVKRLFNPVAFKRKIDGLSQRFRPEVEWDRTISPRPRAGKSYGFTIEDFDTGLTGPSVKGGAAWGLMQWVTERATTVASEFNFQWDSIAAGPPGSKDSSAPVRSASTYAMASAVAAVLALTANNLI